MYIHTHYVRDYLYTVDRCLTPAIENIHSEFFFSAVAYHDVHIGQPLEKGLACCLDPVEQKPRVKCGGCSLVLSCLIHGASLMEIKCVCVDRGRVGLCPA